LTQQKLAELAEMSISHVQRLEDGEHAPTLPLARRIAAALETSVDELWPCEELACPIVPAPVPVEGASAPVERG
jgi:transcriptional regulator with XRE-family HTH domain